MFVSHQVFTVVLLKLSEDWIIESVWSTTKNSVENDCCLKKKAPQEMLSKSYPLWDWLPKLATDTVIFFTIFKIFSGSIKHLTGLWVSWLLKSWNHFLGFTGSLKSSICHFLQHEGVFKYYFYRIFYFGGYGPAPDPDKVDKSCGYFTFNTGSEEQFTVSKMNFMIEQFGLIWY